MCINLEEVDEVMNKMMVEKEDLEQIMNQNFSEDFIIKLEEDKQETVAYIEHVENEEIACMMTGTECEDSKRFMEAKSTFQGRNMG